MRGMGSAGVVYCGTWRGRTVAVKRQHIALAQSSGRQKKMSPDHPAFDVRSRSPTPGRTYMELMQEIMISAQLPAHPNIVQFHGSCLDANDQTVLNCVYEFVGGRDIEQVYWLMNSNVESRWRPSLDLALSWSIQLADGLACLHSARPAVLHRDIKPSNLLITGDLCTLKICDFGLATLKEHDAGGSMLAPARRMTGGTGSYRYMAPEVLNDCGDYDASIDIFSAASCIYFMTTGTVAMSEIEDAYLVAKAVSENVRQPLDMLLDHPALASTISAAWDSNPARRPTAVALAALLRQHRKDVLATPHPTSRSGKLLQRAFLSIRGNLLGYMTGSRPKSKSQSLHAKPDKSATFNSPGNSTRTFSSHRCSDEFLERRKTDLRTVGVCRASHMCVARRCTGEDDTYNRGGGGGGKSMALSKGEVEVSEVDLVEGEESREMRHELDRHTDVTRDMDVRGGISQKVSCQNVSSLFTVLTVT